MTVHRTRPLPRGVLRGCYSIVDSLIEDTQRALRGFDKAGWYEGGHEGICYWAGREEPGLTTMEAALVPEANHRRFGVFVSESALPMWPVVHAQWDWAFLPKFTATRARHPAFRWRRRPCRDAIRKHAVLGGPNYGRNLRAITDFSIHQFQDHRCCVIVIQFQSRSSLVSFYD